MMMFMKYVLFLLSLTSSLYLQGQSVIDKSVHFFQHIPGRVKYSVYSLPDDNEKRMINVIVDSMNTANVDSMYAFAHNAGIVVLDYAIFDSCTKYISVKFDFTIKNRKDTLHLGIYLSPDQFEKYRKRKEHFDIDAKCRLLQNTVFFNFQDYLIEKDTIVFYVGAYDAEAYETKVSKHLDALAPFIQDYIFRGTKKMFVSFEIYDKQWIRKIVYNKIGLRIANNLLVLPQKS